MRLLISGLLLTVAIDAFAQMPSPRTLDRHCADMRPGLAAILARWDNDAHADLRGVHILRDGRLVAERYYNGARGDDLHDVRSAGKSITALVMGLALDRGAVRSVDDPVERYWPEAAGSAIGKVALTDVLTMRSGLAAFDDDPASPGNEDLLDAAADPLAFILDVVRVETPGSHYRYNSLTASVAGIVIAKATGQSMGDFAKASLFDPLGIEHWRWNADAAGYTKGQGNLFLRLRDLAAIGEMVRQDGVYQGQRIVSASWIEQALAARVAIGDVDRYADTYGYYWYGKTYRIADQSVRVHFASGNGGNKIYVVPSHGMVIAITSAAYGEGHGQRRSETILLAVLDSLNLAGENACASGSG